MSQGKSFGGQAVIKKSGIEVQAQTAFGSPIDPAGKRVERVGVAVGRDTPFLSVASVQVEFGWDGDELKGQVEVGPKLITMAGAAWIVSGGGETGAGHTVLVAGFQTGQVVALPALQGEREGCELREGGLGIDTLFGINLTGEGIGL